jgi:hypothetical protein
VGASGKLILPDEVRKDLSLIAGSQMEFAKTDARWLPRPAATSVSGLKGTLKKPHEPVSVDDMNLAIRKRATR